MTPLDLQAGAKRLRDAELPRLAPPFQPLRLGLVGGLPTSAMPGERPRRWGLDPVTEAAIKETHTLLLKSCPGAAQELSLYRAFQRWRTANSYDAVCHGEVLAIFTGYLALHDLAASTCATYVRQALGFCRREPQGQPPRWDLCSSALKGLDLRAATPALSTPWTSPRLAPRRSSP